MTQTLPGIKRQSFFKRFIVPVGIIVISAAASWLMYSNSSRINNDSIHRIIASLSGAVLFLALGHGTLLSYPLMYFRGASTRERILGSLVTFIAWTFKELVRVSEYFTPGETLYYGLGSIFILILLGTFGQMGACELICRTIARKRGFESGKILTPVPVIAIIAAVAALYLLLIWGVGVHWFYIYMEGYKALFY